MFSLLICIHSTQVFTDRVYNLKLDGVWDAYGSGVVLLYFYILVTAKSDCAYVMTWEGRKDGYFDHQKIWNRFLNQFYCICLST